MSSLLSKIGAVALAVLLGGSYVLYRSGVVEAEAFYGTKSAPVRTDDLVHRKFGNGAGTPRWPSSAASEPESNVDGRILLGDATGKSAPMFRPEKDVPNFTGQPPLTRDSLLPASKADVYLPDNLSGPTFTGGYEPEPLPVQQGVQQKPRVLLPGSKSMPLISTERTREAYPSPKQPVANQPRPQATRP